MSIELVLDFGIGYLLYDKKYYQKIHWRFRLRVEALRFQIKKSLNIAIKKVRPGNTIGDIGNTIQRYVEKRGFNVVRELCGHGIGKDLHEDPEILNYGKRKTGDKILHKRIKLK